MWDLLSDFTLQPEVDDTHLWQLSSSGVYSDLHMRDFLLEPFSLELGRESGGAGHHANASSSCG